MGKIAVVENGRVYIRNSGCAGYIKTFSVSGETAVFADYNIGNDRVLVTTASGWVLVCSDNGGVYGRFKSNCDSPITIARWDGSNILCQMRNGKSALYNSNGYGLIRYL